MLTSILDIRVIHHPPKVKCLLLYSKVTPAGYQYFVSLLALNIIFLCEKVGWEGGIVSLYNAVYIIRTQNLAQARLELMRIPLFYMAEFNDFTHEPLCLSYIRFLII